MIKVITSFLIITATFISTAIFAQDTYFSNDGRPVALSYSFVKLGGGYVPLGKGIFGPSIGVGHRFVKDDHAIEISVNWVGARHNMYSTFPKVLYLQYLNPFEDDGVYLGAGLSYGAVGTHHRHFKGIQIEGAMGYEFPPNSWVRPFVELNVSQSLVALTRKHHKSGPVVTLAWGVGF